MHICNINVFSKGLAVYANFEGNSYIFLLENIPSPPPAVSKIILDYKKANCYNCYGIIKGFDFYNFRGGFHERL